MLSWNRIILQKLTTLNTYSHENNPFTISDACNPIRLGHGQNNQKTVSE